MSFKLPSYNELNNTQKLIIYLLTSDKMDQLGINKLAVIGAPGTGKTLITILAATMNNSKPNNNLIVSHSRLLSHQISAIIDKITHENEITINTYHSWFWYALKDILLTSPKSLLTKKFQYDLDKLKVALGTKSEKEKLKYDYMFVDEAQDVQDGLLKFFCEFCKVICVTFDDNQKVGNEEINDSLSSYDHSNILLDLGINDRFFDLIDNYRNTKEIEQVAKLLISSYNINDVTLERITSTREGSKVKLIYGNDVMTYKKIAQYIVNHYDKSKSMAVLFDSTGKDSKDKFLCLKAYIAAEMINQHKYIPFFYKFGTKFDNDEKSKKMNTIEEKNVLNNAIFLMSFKVCKGLEFDDVFLLTSDVKIDDYQGKNSFYVALTRAKSNAYILLDGGKNSPSKINKLLLNNKNLFDIEKI